MQAELTTSQHTDRDLRNRPANRELLIAHALPYLAYVAASGSAPWIGRAAAYGLAGIAASALLVRARRDLRPLRGPKAAGLSTLCGIVSGLLGTAAWIALKLPFLGETASAASATASWSVAALLARSLASVCVVPWVEEHLMRSCVLGLVVQWQRARRAGRPSPWAETLDRASILELEPGACSLLAASVSTIVFALGHASSEWVAALVYGGLLVALYAWRRDLLSVVVAHATTNAALIVWVLWSGRFDAW